MIKRFKSKKIIQNNRIFDGYVYTNEGKITAVTAAELPFDIEEDLGDNYLAPGFIDLHVHGAMGFDFGNCDAKEAAQAIDYHLSHGTTTILPTFAASSHKNTLLALESLNECIKGELAHANVPGVHLEGPYFSLNQCGAQNPENITAPIKEDYEYILKEYSDIVKRWSYAPERDEDEEFCKAVTKAGVIASAGHTDAEYADMERAHQNGCSLITHLYSCTSTVVRKNAYRHAGVNEFAFYNDDIFAEIITDGAHLPPELIRLVYKIKGRDRVALITDSMSVCGVDKKSGNLNGIDYIVEDGVCKLADRSSFAGSIATANRLVYTCVKKAGLSLIDSVYMAATVPAKILKVSKGMIKERYDADLIAFDDDINIKAVYVGGKKYC